MNKATIFTRSEDLQIEELQGEGLILNQQTLETHHLNQHSFLVLNLFNGERALNDVIELLTEAYPGEDSIEADVLETTQKLLDSGIIKLVS